jgi:TolA-binding protein
MSTLRSRAWFRGRPSSAAPLGLVLALAAGGCGGETAQRPPNGQDAKVIVCAPGSFAGGNECLPLETQCPSGTALQDGNCVAIPVAVAGDPPPPDPVATAQAAPALPFMFALDTRRSRTQPRSRQLLITELQGLESLFQTTPKDAADRPKLVRRLAEGYVELSAAAVRDSQVTTSGPDKAQKLEQIVKAQKVEQAARKAAIKYYQLLVQQYPSFCQSANPADPSKSTGCADEASYYVSLEYVLSNDRDQARRSMLALLQNHPQSRYLGQVYFLFGELFFQEAEVDPSKWPLAAQAYQEAAKFPSSPAAPYALLRLSEVHTKQGDGQKAQAALQKLSTQFPAFDAANPAPAAP